MTEHQKTNKSLKNECELASYFEVMVEKLQQPNVEDIVTCLANIEMKDAFLQKHGFVLGKIAALFHTFDEKLLEQLDVQSSLKAGLLMQTFHHQ